MAERTSNVTGMTGCAPPRLRRSRWRALTARRPKAPRSPPGWAGGVYGRGPGGAVARRWGQAGRRGSRALALPPATAENLTPQQRLLLLHTWLRSGLPAGDFFAAMVGLSKHTLLTAAHAGVQWHNRSSHRLLENTDAELGGPGRPPRALDRVAGGGRPAPGQRQPAAALARRHSGRYLGQPPTADSRRARALQGNSGATPGRSLAGEKPQTRGAQSLAASSSRPSGVTSCARGARSS